MEKEIMNMIVVEGCNKALEECEEYLEKEYGGKLSEDELRVMEGELIYKKAVKDTFDWLQYFKVI